TPTPSCGSALRATGCLSADAADEIQSRTAREAHSKSAGVCALSARRLCPRDLPRATLYRPPPPRSPPARSCSRVPRCPVDPAAWEAERVDREQEWASCALPAAGSE